VQRILDENPTEPLAVFVVWFAVLGPDSAESIDVGLISDPRVRHYWDSDEEVSEFFSAHSEEVGVPGAGLLWDAYLLFDSEARWEETPGRQVGFGAPVVSETERLSGELEAIWGA
jgi:hypothetical protein